MNKTSYGFNMADDTRKVRVEEQLKVKIGEAKNLQSRHSNNNNGQNGLRDIYCTVALDQEEISRTQTVERTLSPFFGEEYQFEIPRKFRYLAIYVWDRDKHLKQDKAIGKIAIKREELNTYNHKDHWFPLRPVDADSEVQGMVHIKVTINEGFGNLKRKSNFDESMTIATFDSTNNELPDNNLCGDVSVSRSESVKTTSSSIGASSTGSTLSKTKGIFSHTTELSLWTSNSKKSAANTLDGLSPFRCDVKSSVAVNVVECVDLAKKNGNCDPYIILTAMYTNKRKITKRTKVRKKTVAPTFDETVHFDLNVDCDSKPSGNNAYTVAPLGGSDLCEICVAVWHDAGMGEHVFLGEVKLPMRGKQQQNSIQAGAWYLLKPRSSQSRSARSCATPPGTRLSCDNSLGSMRLQLVYTADHVFPLANYDNLLNMLIQSIDQRPITASAVYILGEVISNKTEVAQPLVRVFTYKNLISPMIKALADHEISKLTDPTTIFRGNTLVSKMMDEAMRLSGLHYLHSTLRPIVEQILLEKKPCEIDPTRVTNKTQIEANLVNLEDYVEKVIDAITNSAVRCPAVLCQIFYDLRECAAKHFPDNKEVRYSVVSGFIFLRFFAPAILGPKLFDLTTEPLDAQTNRTLTLISKTIQSLGNLVSSRSAQQLCKEVYTGQLYKKFCTDRHVQAVKHFLEVISAVGSNPSESTLLQPVLLKEGMMTKRSQGRKIFGRCNFNQRYFRLTTQSLSYAKSKGKRTICDIPLSEILAVERLNERSFKMQNIFQIIRRERTLYVQTSNCVEEKEWVDLLSKICQSNAARLEYYHPCAYISGIWTCCEESDQNAKGCKSVSPLPLQMELAAAIDPARDLQRLQTLMINNITRLKSNDDLNNFRSLSFEDADQTHKTIQLMTKVAYNLDQIHRNYKSILAREMKYGSRQAPIGDDNYLHMIRGGLNSTATMASVQQQKLTPVTSAAATSFDSNCFRKSNLFRNSFNNQQNQRPQQQQQQQQHNHNYQ